MPTKAPDPGFRAVHAALGRAVRKAFPNAKATNQWGLEGWTVKRPAGAPKPAREGTLDSGLLFVGLAERKAGLTFYVWYPGAAILEAHEATLRGAGYKVMKGCLQWTRKAGPPLAPIEAVLRDMRKRDRVG